MKHNIEISTVEALVLLQVLDDNNLYNENDKRICRKLGKRIGETASKDLMMANKIKIEKPFECEPGTIFSMIIEE